MTDDLEKRLADAEAEVVRLIQSNNEWQLAAAQSLSESMAAEDALRTLRERVAAVEALVDSWEHGADTWGTCSHEWVSLRKLRAALADVPTEATPPAEQRAEGGARCRDCGAQWVPVRRGECLHCGSDAGPAPEADHA